MGLNMNDWLHNLPIVWMALLVSHGWVFVTALAKGERARAFKAISPGMLRNS